MQRFKNIFVPYFSQVGDEATLTRAVQLAKRNDAVVTVAEVPKRSASYSVVLEQRGRLDRVIASIQQDGVEARARVLAADAPFLEIIREVLRGAHDLVILTAEATRGVKGVLFGTTSMHLMRKCPCPVWVTHPQQSASYKNILAAVELSGPAENDTLSQLIVELASSLARQEQCQLHFVHAWNFVGDDLTSAQSEITPDMMAALVKRNEQPLETRFKKLLEAHDLTDIEHSVRLVRGGPESVIPKLASEEDMDLIVMGTVCRTGVAGFFIGNTAETVLQQVECSVLTVKPRGFATPIALDVSG